jgi:hypothetical protein
MADVKESSFQDLTYSIVITNVFPERINSLSTEFANVFGLESSLVTQILKGSPIIFAEKLPRNDIRAIKPKLLELSKGGIEFTITTEVSSFMPKVLWTIPFRYIEGKTGDLLKSVNFQWNGNAFSCPSCGETFVFQRIGNPFAEKAAPCAETKSDAKDQPNLPKTQPAIPIKQEAVPEKIMGLTPIEEEVLEPIPEILELTPENSAEALEAIEEVIDAPEIIEEAIMGPTVDMALQDIRAYPSSKRENAAKIISEISDKPIEEIRKLISRSSSPMFSEISESQATEGMEQLKKIGISVKILKKKV